MAGRADVMAGRAYVSLYAKRDLLTRGLQAARADVNKFGSDMIRMGAQVVAATAAIAAPVAFATKTFADFDDAMRAVGAVSQATAAELQAMTDVAKKLGATTSFTAIQVAQLMGELGRAGFKPDQVNAMTAAVMNLARATGTDATLASGIMAATIRQFSLQAGDAARVADVLTHAANATFNSVESLGESLKYAGPVAAELGLSLEDTAAILGTLGNVGIQGSEAGTALRRLGVISAATGEDLKKIFDINNVDMAGNLRPLVSIMDDIGKSIENLPTAEKVAKLNEAFGLLGITSASVLSRTAGSTADLANELRNVSGVADRTARDMDAGLGGAFRIIWSAVEGLQIALGKALSGSIQRVTDTMTALISKATEWVGANEDTVTSLAAVTIAVAALGSTMIGLGIAAKVTAIGFGILISGISIIKGAVSIALGAVRLFRAATVGLATLMQGAFAASATASAVAVTALAAAESASIITLVPYTAGLITAANAQALLGITSGATTTALIAASGAMTLATAGNVGLITSSAGASGGLITLSGSAAVASAGVAGVSASAGVMATAFTAASGVIATAWGIILGPLTPFILAAGTVVAVITAITAAATVSTVRAMDFSKAWTIAKDTLSAVITIAKQVGGILMTALQQGDYDVAFKAAMAGVKLVFATLIDSMGQMWETFWDGAWKSVKTFMSEFAKLSSKVVVAVAKAIANPVTGQLELANTIAGMTKDINLSFKIDTEGMASTAKAELDKLEKELADRQAKRDAENKGKDEPGGKPLTVDEARQKYMEAGNKSQALWSKSIAAGESNSPEWESLREQAQRAQQETDAAYNALQEAKKREAERPAAPDAGQAFGDQSAAQMDGAAAAEEAKSAFDRETESIRQQIIALKEGEDAAERFRLSKQGLTDAEIDQVMALRAEQEAITKEQENARRIVERIQDYADAEASNKDNTLTPAQIAAKEKAAIDLNLRQGRIDAQTAEEAMAQADIRQAEREHQDRLKKLRGEGDASIGSQSFGLKSGGASAATFSAQSLLSMGSGVGQGPQLRAMLETKRLIAEQTKKQEEQSEAQIAAIKNSKMKHG